MNMKLRMFSVLLALNLTFSINVQATEHIDKKVIDTVSIVDNYVDSLILYKNSINTNTHYSNYNSSFSRLFFPLTFFHSPAKEELSIDSINVLEEDQIVNDVLLALYLRRPDLIRTTESQLDKVGTLRKDEVVPKKTKVILADKVTPQIEHKEPVAPTGIVITKPNFWKFSANTKYQLQQYYYSENWHKGGESNYTMFGEMVLRANYNNKQKIKFDNELVMQLGFRNTREDTLHKFKTNTDVIRYTGKLGLQATKKWYYSFELIAYTQFTQGHKSNDSYVYSDFMSPFNLNLSVGMDYSVATKNNRLRGSINLAPLAFNFKYVDRKNLASRYGIKGNHRTAEDFGSKINVNLEWKISDLLSWKTRFYGYTSYKRALVEWENTFNLRISKYISANLVLYPRFDDSTKRDEDLGYLQFQEYSTLGFEYSF